AYPEDPPGGDPLDALYGAGPGPIGARGGAAPAPARLAGDGGCRRGCRIRSRRRRAGREAKRERITAWREKSSPSNAPRREKRASLLRVIRPRAIKSSKPRNLS